jgi:hypothetical protein
MTAFRRACLVGLAVATCAVIGGAQAAVSRSGVISKFDGVDEGVETCTSAKSHADMPKMSLTFTSSGGPSSALVTFSGSASLAGTKFDTGFVRLLVDGQQQSPGEVAFVAVGETSAANAFTWETKPLAAGKHKVQVQWRTKLGFNFCFDARSLVVLHQ